MNNKLLPSVTDLQVASLIKNSVMNVREDMQDNPYIQEAIRVLPVQGYRSAIGSFWNAVVDDLRNKIMHRSLDLFNKEIKPRREVKTYEDFQNHINDDELIEGAYKIGIISWEGQKILKHAKETRHIFDGHPKSSEPDIFKVLSMFNDCIKYVLNNEYPSKIINISEYIDLLGSNSFDRNKIAVSNAFGDLPEVYKNELIRRLFDIYIHPQTTSTLNSNVEFTAPILWSLLPKDIQKGIVRNVDKKIIDGNVHVTDKAFNFVKLVSANKYLSQTAREYKLHPWIQELKNNTNVWDIENKYVKLLSSYADIIPMQYIPDYVWGLTHTYIGSVGSSYQYSRTDFYANEASVYIPDMFEKFDSNMAMEFVNTIKRSESIKRLVRTPSKLRRLRNLAMRVVDKIVEDENRKFLELLINAEQEQEFLSRI